MNIKLLFQLSLKWYYKLSLGVANKYARESHTHKNSTYDMTQHFVSFIGPSENKSNIQYMREGRAFKHESVIILS